MNTTSRPRRKVICADCKQHKPHAARGLCGACRMRHKYHGTLDNFARTKRPMAETVDDVKVLTLRGLGRRDIAEHLHLSERTVYRVFAAARVA